VTDPGPIQRLLDAVNDHDLAALAACFAEDYRNETPAHPARSFRGREQVRRNWEQLFGAIPDLAATVTARADAGTTVWTEWEMRGTRPDGGTHLMRGVVVFETASDEISAARFYLEPVDPDPAGVDAAIADAIGPARA
jgi:ketosteroid isomerase-like protein